MEQALIVFFFLLHNNILYVLFITVKSVIPMFLVFTHQKYYSSDKVEIIHATCTNHYNFEVPYYLVI